MTVNGAVSGKIYSLLKLDIQRNINYVTPEINILGDKKKSRPIVFCINKSQLSHWYSKLTKIKRGMGKGY